MKDYDYFEHCEQQKPELTSVVVVILAAVVTIGVAVFAAFMVWNVWIRTETGERLAFIVDACTLVCAIAEILRRYPETVTIAAQPQEQEDKCCL